METRNTTWDELPELMTVKETADALRVSTNWVYEAARSGDLKTTTTKLGRSIRVRKTALLNFLEAGS